MDSDNIEDVIGEAASELSNGGGEAVPAPDPVATPTEAATPIEAATPAPANETAEQKADRERDQKGRFAPKPKDAPKAAEKASATAEVKPTEPNKEAAVPEAQKPAEAALKAPQSWKPVAREKWSTLPREVQEEAHRLDREIRQTLEQTASVRKEHEAVQQAARPYEMLLRSRGQSVPQALEGYLRMDAVLSTGTRQQKAALLAQLWRQADVQADDINEAFQSGAQPVATQPQQQAAQPAEDVEQRVMQRIQLQQAQAFWADFATKHEFFEDVRQDVALILKAAADQGRQIAPEDAYKRALAMNDSVQQALAQRKEAEAAAQHGQTANQARAAAVSVRSQPAGVAPQKKMESIDDFIEAAAEELRARR